MKYKKWLPVFILVPLCFFLISTSLVFVILSSEIGYVADKNENRIGFVQNKKFIEKGKYENAGEIGEVYYEMKWVPSFIKSKVEVGQKVEVFSIGSMQGSDPRQAHAIFIVILDDES